MKQPTWQPRSPIQAISFDCDGTLSTIEGIDYLAALNNQADAVGLLTHQAMSNTGLSLSLYRERLSKVQPSEAQLRELSYAYLNHLTRDVADVIELLQQLNKTVYIISAGNNPAVAHLGQHLKIPESHCYAVDLYFDSNGNYRDFDQQSPLVRPMGKSAILETIKIQHGSVLHIGDGMNDLDSKDAVTRFVGYGGVFKNEKVAQHAPFYISGPSLLPLLALTLTQSELSMLNTKQLQQYQRGVALLTQDLTLKTSTSS